MYCCGWMFWYCGRLVSSRNLGRPLIVPPRPSGIGGGCVAHLLGKCPDNSWATVATSAPVTPYRGALAVWASRTPAELRALSLYMAPMIHNSLTVSCRRPCLNRGTAKVRWLWTHEMNFAVVSCAVLKAALCSSCCSVTAVLAIMPLHCTRFSASSGHKRQESLQVPTAELRSHGFGEIWQPPLAKGWTSGSPQ